MTRTIFDLFIIGALSQQLFQFTTAGNIPGSYMAIGIIVIPFTLGISREGKRAYFSNPIGTTIRLCISIISFFTFIVMDILFGTKGLFLSVFLTAMIPYIFGRILGWTPVGLIIFLIALFGAIYFMPQFL